MTRISAISGGVLVLGAMVYRFIIITWPVLAKGQPWWDL